MQKKTTIIDVNM